MKVKNGRRVFEAENWRQESLGAGEGSKGSLEDQMPGMSDEDKLCTLMRMPKREFRNWENKIMELMLKSQWFFSFYLKDLLFIFIVTEHKKGH